ncbi:MAG: DinB family protein [Planctomycetota bacterium]
MHDQVLTPWTARRWRFDFPAELHPAVIERLRGTPSRAAEAVEDLPEGQLRDTSRHSYSIKRHIGHLGDLEALLNARLDAYERREHILPAADMMNGVTQNAPHDDTPIADQLAELRTSRAATLVRLDAYDPDFFGRSAWHERLGVQKRVVDTCVFFADHDDHHLALIRMIRKSLGDQ